VRALLIAGAGYPLALAVQVVADRLTGWTIADAFGKAPPR
jgi:hypothetical protein